MPRKKTKTGFSKQKVGIIGDSCYGGWQNLGLNKMISKSENSKEYETEKKKTSEQTDLTPVSFYARRVGFFFVFNKIEIFKIYKLSFLSNKRTTISITRSVSLRQENHSLNSLDWSYHTKPQLSNDTFNHVLSYQQQPQLIYLNGEGTYSLNWNKNALPVLLKWWNMGFFIGFPVLIGRKQFTQKLSPLIRKCSQVIRKTRSDFQTGKYTLASILDKLWTNSCNF